MEKPRNSNLTAQFFFILGVKKYYENLEKQEWKNLETLKKYFYWLKYYENSKKFLVNFFLILLTSRIKIYFYCAKNKKKNLDTLNNFLITNKKK